MKKSTALLVAILALSALTGAAAPQAISWTHPTTYEDGTPLLPSEITGANIYMLGTGSAPVTTGPSLRWYSVSGNQPLGVIDITLPTWVQVAVIAGTEGVRSAPVLIVPKFRPAAPASVGLSVRPPTVCSVPAGCPGP